MAAAAKSPRAKATAASPRAADHSSGEPAQVERLKSAVEDEAMRRKWIDCIPHDRMQMVIRQPFTGALAMQMPLIPVIDARVPTACTDGKTTYFNPYFFEKMKPDERRFVLAHEVWHSALSHFIRRGSRDPEQWNVATDLEINRMLKVEYGSASPKEALYGENVFGEDWTKQELFKAPAEELYERLLQRQQKKQNSGNGQGKGQPSGSPNQPGQGPAQAGSGNPDPSGSGEPDPSGNGGSDPSGSGKSDPSGKAGGKPSKSQAGGGGNPAGQAPPKQDRGKYADDHQWDSPSDQDIKEKIAKSASDPNSPYHKLVDENGNPKVDPSFNPGVPTKDTQHEWNQRIVQTAQRMQQRGRGTLPGEFQSIVDAITQPKIPWKQTLSRFIETNASGQGYDWTTPRRRYLPLGVIMPDRREPKLTLNVAFDTSGSVGDDEIRSFLAEVNGVAEAFPQYELRLVQCDAEVSSSKIYTKDEPFEPTNFVITGRGGTAFTPVFEHIEEQARMNGQTERTPLLYFTDGAGDNPKEPDFPVLWCLVGADSCSATFGEKLRIDRDELLNKE